MVFVCTPSNHHIRPAIKAAKSGCNLFIEKPLSNTAEGIPELLDIVDEQNLITMIGCNYRFHPAIQTVKEILESGVLGDIVSARIETGSYLPDWHPWEDYREMYSAKEGVGGVLFDAIHGVNYARWFFDDEVVVTAMLGHESSLDMEPEDTASLIARYENGIQCEFHFDYVQRTSINSGHITGERGSIRWGGENKTVVRSEPPTEEWILEEDYSGWDVNNMYTDMMEHFVKCVDEGEKTISSLHDGWKDLQLALAGKKSSSEGKHIEL
jgi:predicted dehydrogenase